VPVVDLTPAFPWGLRRGDRETNNSCLEDERLSLLSRRPLIRTASCENESQSREACARTVKQPSEDPWSCRSHRPDASLARKGMQMKSTMRDIPGPSNASWWIWMRKHIYHNSSRKASHLDLYGVSKFWFSIPCTYIT